MIVHSLDLGGRPVYDRDEIFEGPDVLAVLDDFRTPRGFTMMRATDRDGFIEECLSSLRDTVGLDFSVDGETEEARAESFFRVLVENGLAEWAS